MRAYIDADILIWHLRGDSRALAFLKEMRRAQEFELWVGAMQRAEVVFFMRPGEEEATLLFLSLFKTAPVDQAIIDKAGALYRQFHGSHNIDTNDAILAATAILTGGKVYTLNTKHFEIPHLPVQRPWE